MRVWNLREWVDVLRGVGDEVYLRFAHEFNGSWYPWTPAAGISADTYVPTWRRVHDVFSQDGVASHDGVGHVLPSRPPM